MNHLISRFLALLVEIIESEIFSQIQAPHSVFSVLSLQVVDSFEIGRVQIEQGVIIFLEAFVIVAFRDHGNPTRDEKVENNLRRRLLVFIGELSELNEGEGFSLHVSVCITRGCCVLATFGGLLFFSFFCRGGVGAYQRII